MITRSQLVNFLSFAGLLPMAAACIYIEFDKAVLLLSAYSLAIIAFLAGNAWSIALLSRAHRLEQRASVLVLSNAVVLVAVALAVTIEGGALFVGFAILFAVLLVAEYRFAVFAARPHYYRNMRLRVTSIAILIHLFAAWRVQAS
ncbi:MAG: DUF3429 family protein [Pseudomonadota bacterium]